MRSARTRDGSFRTWTWAGWAAADAEERRLDIAQPVDVAADPGGDVAEEKGLGEAHDRVGERLRLDRRLVRPPAHLLLDQLRDAADEVGLDPPGARGDDPQGRLALLLDVLAQRGGSDDAAVEPVERVQERAPAPAPGLGARDVEERVGRPRQHLAHEAVTPSEPPVHGGAAETESERDGLHVDALTAQVAVHGSGQ